MKKMIMVGVLALGMQVQAQALWQPSERLVQWEPSWNSILNQEGYSAKKKGGVTKSKGGVKSSSKSSFSGASFGNNTIRANIGLGPSWNNFVGRISEDHFRMGLAIDAYLVTPPAVVKEERKNIDPRFRNLLPADQEMISRPWFWALIPTSIMFNPHFNDLGVYGFTMSAVSVFYSYSPVPEMIFKGGVEAPTISIFRMNGDLLQERDWFIGVGASLKADVFMRFSDRMLLSSGWTSAFYLPGNDTEITFYDGESEKVWHIGTIDLQLHYRFAYMRK